MTYTAFIEHDGHAWGGTVPDLHATVAGSSRDEVLHLLAESVAFTLHGLAEEGQQAPLPRIQGLVDLPEDDRPDFAGMEVVQVEPAPINPVSAEVDRAIRASGLSEREIARRMVGGNNATVNRLRDLFYWGHSLETLGRLATALGKQLEVHLVAPAKVKRRAS